MLLFQEKANGQNQSLKGHYSAISRKKDGSKSDHMALFGGKFCRWTEKF
jgi:hypothetical protein